MNPERIENVFYPLPNDGIVGSLGSIPGTGFIFVIRDGRGGGLAAPLLHGNEPKKIHARSERARSAANTF
jgi:hypothetical protein